MTKPRNKIMHLTNDTQSYITNGKLLLILYVRLLELLHITIIPFLYPM